MNNTERVWIPKQSRPLLKKKHHHIMKKALFIFASALLLTACSKPYRVAVDYENVADNTPIVLLNYFTNEVVDSTVFTDGKALFEGEIPTMATANRPFSSSNRER